MPDSCKPVRPPLGPTKWTLTRTAWKSAALLAAGLLAGEFIAVARVAAASPEPATTAAEVDALLAAQAYGRSPTENGSESARPAPVADDVTLLRRLSLDLLGELPSPEELIRFALDPSPHKRSAEVERLLADGRYGHNWARYSRDVILSRARKTAPCWLRRL